MKDEVYDFLLQLDDVQAVFFEKASHHFTLTCDKGDVSLTIQDRGEMTGRGAPPRFRATAKSKQGAEISGNAADTVTDALAALTAHWHRL